jgi:AAA15 family ATPase/GTPase
MIKELELKNFAAFKELKLQFSPKINVIIGENSCGKTQILKSIYALANEQGVSTGKLFELFKPHKEALTSLYHRSGEGDAKLLISDSKDNRSEITFSNKSRNQIQTSPTQLEGQCLLIPTKEVLSLLPALKSSKVDKEGLSDLFDASVIDLCELLLKEPKDDTNKHLNSDPRAATIAPKLVKAVGGKFVIDGADQYFVAGQYRDKRPQGLSNSKQAKVYADYTELTFEKNDGTETSVTMTAEGYRKIGLLQRLLENGALTQSGRTTILWDEPEANMNPSLIRMLVECLLTLSRNGQQVIIATHNYVLLKWFDLLVDAQKGDHITYHALYRDKSKDIKIESNSNYKMLSANAIANTYSELYDEEIERSLGGVK